MSDILKATARGVADHGWLRSRHSFSFGQYHNPAQIGFSDLRVINDDRVMAGQGFGQHPHRDMEIFSYVLEGDLAHQDSMGNGSVIRPGDVQLMSAGSGVTHSEFNHSTTDAVHFLQIWLLPATLGATPRYQQTHFSAADKRGKLALIIGPRDDERALQIRQDAHVYAGLFDGDEQATLALAPHRYAYVHVARGSVAVNGQRLDEGDGMRLRDVEQLRLDGGHDAEVLVFDLRPHELPGMA